MLLARPIRALQSKRLVRAVNSREPATIGLSDRELRDAGLALRHRARCGSPPGKLLVEAFALAREAARRSIGLRHFDVQLIGGLALCRRGLAEMQTGEGKTLTAVLPLYVFALYGRGAHLATVNDYLARRDAEQMRPVFSRLGLTTGVVTGDADPEARRNAYACDITYGTAREFGFDYLRDRLAKREQDDAGSNLFGRLCGERDTRGNATQLQREPHFMLVDEADSVLIDDAGTPLVIATASREAAPAVAARYRFAASVVAEFAEFKHYTFDPTKHKVELTSAGREQVRRLRLPEAIRSLGLVSLYEDVERAILVERLYLRDRNYVLRDGEVAIVDEFTGRIAEGRKWRGGIHQAVEAKELLRAEGDAVSPKSAVKISDEGGQAARITVQEFFLRYPRLAGMSGTAIGSARELRRIYKLRVEAIPTNRPPIRRRLPTRIFAAADDKRQAIVAEVAAMAAAGRPVLIGTRSIDKSLRLSELLVAAGIDHEVLNAHHEAREAEIVARAGGRGRVTVATNMAGRGTDIRLGDGVAELGGLHVVVTEMHESARIDRQLIGRCGRQGDPGSFRMFLSLDDELLREGLGEPRAMRLRSKYAAGEVTGSRERWFRQAQRKVELRKYRQRKKLLTFERRRSRQAKPLGLDPHLDLPG